MHDKDGLTASQEDYLEAIHAVLREQPVVRSKDLAERLSVTPASVTGALRQLAARAYVHYEPYGLITLTVAGQRAAEEIVERHRVLRDFFVRVLGVAEAEADDSACRLEHALAPAVQERLVQFVDFLDRCRFHAAEGWEKRFRYLARTGRMPPVCRECLSSGRGDGSKRPRQPRAGHAAAADR